MERKQKIVLAEGLCFLGSLFLNCHRRPTYLDCLLVSTYFYQQILMESLLSDHTHLSPQMMTKDIWIWWLRCECN